MKHTTKYLCIALILLLATAVSAHSIQVDSNAIQQYRGSLGKWIQVDSPGTLHAYAKKFSVDPKDVYTINGTNGYGPLVNNYVFFPFSKEYLKELASKGITRQTVEDQADKFFWPIRTFGHISSVLGNRWGRFHPGVDIPSTRETPIHAAQSGRVIYARYCGGYGLTVAIEHKNNLMTRYAHNSVNLVKEGDFVQKGQIIALVGSTGNSTGNHLHFEVRCNDIPLDPLDFLPRIENIQKPHSIKSWK